MDVIQADNVGSNLSDNLDLASWNRERSTEELRSFVETRFAALPDQLEVE